MGVDLPLISMLYRQLQFLDTQNRQPKQWAVSSEQVIPIEYDLQLIRFWVRLA
jgi:hypothetical protein